MNEILASSLPLTRENMAAIAEENRKKQEDDWKDYKASTTGKDGTVKFTRSLNFAVLQVGTNRYGLVVDRILGAEEIVVKPLHSMVKNLECYAGTTVMGDGRVSLILDIPGIAVHAGITFHHDERVEAELIKDVHDEKQTVLLFKNGELEQFAVALPLIRRIEKIKKSRMERIGSKEFITIDGVSTMVLRLDNLLKVSPCREREEMFFLLPKYIQRPFGILMSSLVDIETCEIQLNTESYKEPGILGTAIHTEGSHETLSGYLSFD